MVEGKSKIREAILRDKVLQVDPDGGFFSDITFKAILSDYLATQPGVTAFNLTGKIYEFVSETHERREIMERYYSRIGERGRSTQEVLKSDFPSDADPLKGPAEEMDELVGPYIAGGLVGYFTPAGELISTTVGAFGVPAAGDVSTEVGGAYEQYTDITRNNALLLSIQSGHSPVPDESLFADMAEAFDKLFSKPEE
jgi:hypothetical protein